MSGNVEILTLLVEIEEHEPGWALHPPHEPGQPWAMRHEDGRAVVDETAWLAVAAVWTAIDQRREVGR